MDRAFFMLRQSAVLLGMLTWLRPVLIGLLLVLLVLSFRSKTANVLFSFLYPICAGVALSLWFFGSALGIIESEAEFGYNVIMGAGMGLFFGLAQAFQAYAREKATIGETFVKLFLTPIAMLILGIGLLIACGIVLSFSKDPVTTTICLILLLALFGGGGGTVVAIIFER